MTELTSQRDHYPALDGLRGIAILLVVFFHNFGFTNYCSPRISATATMSSFKSSDRSTLDLSIIKSLRSDTGEC